MSMTQLVERLEAIPEADHATRPSALIEDAPADSLRRRAVSSGLVTATAQVAKFFLNLTMAVVLARLLTPQDFGLVAMASAVTVFLGVFKDAGLSTATIQREEITQAQVSNLFWINVGLGASMTLVGVALSGVVAWFYHDPRLTAIMAALSLTFVISSSTVQHHALLVRQMRFKALAAIEVGAMLLGIVVAVALAISSFGYWALVYMYLANGGVALALTWFVSGWRPSLPRRRTGVRPLVHFGLHLTLSDVVSRLSWGSDSVLVGRVYGAATVGLYSRANVLFVRPLDQLLSPTTAVVVPLLSRLQNDAAAYRRSFLQAYEALALASFLLAGFLLGLSRPLVMIVLGPGWEGAVPVFAAFTVAGLSMPMVFAASWLFTSQGRGGDWLRLTILLGLVTVAGYVAGLPFGALGVALGFSASGVLLRVPLAFRIAGRSGPVTAGDLWSGFLNYLPSWAAVSIVAFAVRSILASSNDALQTIAGGTAGLLAGLVVIAARRRTRTAALYAATKVWDAILRWRES